MKTKDYKEAADRLDESVRSFQDERLRIFMIRSSFRILDIFRDFKERSNFIISETN